MKTRRFAVIPKSLKSSFLMVLAIFSIAAAPPASYVELNQALNARTDGKNFYKDYAGNYLFTAPPGTIGKIVSSKRLASGNFAYQVQIVKSKNGSQLDKTVWIYDDVKNNPDRLTLCFDLHCQKTTKERSSNKTALRTNTNVPTYASNPKVPGTSELAASGVLCEGTCNEPSSLDTSGLTEKVMDIYRNNPAMGARKVMASMYQSCDVLEKAPYDYRMKIPADAYASFQSDVAGSQRRQVGIRSNRLQDAIRNHYYLNDLKQEPSCHRDVRKSPPGYFYGGRPNQTKYNSEHTIDIFNSQTPEGQNIAKGIGLDCSHFASAAFAAVGRKLTTNGKGNYYMDSRSFLKAGSGQSDDCFSRPSFSGNDSIQQGDVMSFGSHVVIINSITDPTDPFGINKRRRNGEPLTEAHCRQEQDPKHLNFTLIQSTGDGTPKNSNIGVAITSASAYFKPGSSRSDSLSELAQIACYAKLRGSANVPKKPTLPWSLIRHLGDQKPACMDEQGPMHIEDSQCIQGCFENHIRKDS